MKTITYDETKWKLVPVEPTDAMVVAGLAAPDSVGTTEADTERTWAAMLAAAPAPAAQPQAEGGV